MTQRHATPISNTPPIGSAPLPERLHRLVKWMVAGGLRIPTLTDLFEQAAWVLAGEFPIDRASLNLEVVHPELGGQTVQWLREGGISSNQAPRGITATDDYLSSPVRVVDETGLPFRARAVDGHQQMGILKRLFSEGFTDYLLVPLSFQDTHRTAAASFATRQPGGFTAADVADLIQAAAMISPMVEARVIRGMATDLLDVYLGPAAGARVFAGQILRGDTSSIFAAILFCDLRAFTAFTADNLTATVIGRLNDWFGHAVAAVAGRGGEVLKFMGDGMLAIFPADELNPAEACGHALAAADDLARAVESANAAAPAGAVPLEYGLSLHLGHVAFGNIGGPMRLDFTVVGPAVNLASRLMEVGKQVGETVVVSQAFAGCSGPSFDPLGSFDLRGIPQPQKVYRPR